MLRLLLLSPLILWALTVLLAGWFLTRAAALPPEPAPPQPPDPIVELVDKWAHDWERGRA